MKILILSDSHGQTENMVLAVRREHPDQVLHLGDHDSDCRCLEREFPMLPVRCVKGNCDMGSSEDTEAMLTIGGKKILMTHGHRYRVKEGTELLACTAVCEGADAALYGHTHRQDFSQFTDVYLINPGSIGYEGNYGILEIQNGKIEYTPKML